MPEDFDKVIGLIRDEAGELTKFVIENEDHTVREVALPSPTGIGDMLYVYDNVGISVAPVASDTPTRIFDNPDDGAVFGHDGGTSMEWHADTGEVELLVDGLFDGYGSVSWSPAADSSPSCMYMQFITPAPQFSMSAYLPPSVGRTTSQARFNSPFWHPAGTILRPHVTRRGGDVLTANYAEFQLVRIA